ncbi:MAG TPA: hypothetical protein VM600_09685 [Actinomycetota bacterium]|nr:hypothetical protein [Actinomycetota bacterium]
MKRLAFCALLLAAIAVPAQAEDPFTVSGTITAMNPASTRLGGVTEIVSPCGGSVDPEIPDGATQGLDGFWFALPDGGLPGQTATLTSNGIDVDVWWYDAGCSGIFAAATPGSRDMVTPLTANEKGRVPDAAQYGIVDVVAGFNTAFTISIS